jgi:hypothetical protein
MLMTHRLLARPFALVLLALAPLGCGGEDPFQIPTNPTPAVPIVVTFNGTVTRNGAVTHTFTTQASGTVTATLQVATPEGAVVGLSLGTWNGNLCQVVLSKDSAVQGNVVTGNVSALGSLCVRLYDAGGVIAANQPVEYEVKVEHP